MPKNRTMFGNDELTDPKLASWISKSKNNDAALCSLCKRAFCVSNGGLYQVLHHQKGAKHDGLSKALQQQPRLHVTWVLVTCLWAVLQ
jgi:transcriptional regulator GlxA family with amidase domain